MKFLISTDLDGTLLDHHTYSWQAAKPALMLCKELGVPVILNTSKTLVEVNALARELNLNAPMVVENGSALIMPADHELKSQTFGAERSQILAFIAQVRAKHAWSFEGFNDWSIQQICEHTGLSKAAAELAAQKQYSEPFVWHGQPSQLQEFVQLAKQQGLCVLKGGRFYHLQGRTDKAKPLLWLRKNLSQVFADAEYTAPKLICLGDNHNDVAMLNVADIPVCVKSPLAPYPELSTDERVIYTQGEGPVGWNQAIQQILN